MLLGITDDAGYSSGTGSWLQVESLGPSIKPGGQGALHFSIAVDPNDDDNVFIGSSFGGFHAANISHICEAAGIGVVRDEPSWDGGARRAGVGRGGEN